eukprot:TRINITY_DN688_c0_g1_i5.p1 TRINITY_DN688_c0_g1~~TRINITY_DN688_c0_g1_i5.p1  ORF type:complete len:268 (-),score=70.38 TRINITY_DN688_c0_g1_i5:133-936(-)
MAWSYDKKMEHANAFMTNLACKFPELGSPIEVSVNHSFSSSGKDNATEVTVYCGCCQTSFKVFEEKNGTLRFRGDHVKAHLTTTKHVKNFHDGEGRMSANPATGNEEMGLKRVQLVGENAVQSIFGRGLENQCNTLKRLGIVKTSQLPILVNRNNADETLTMISNCLTVAIREELKESYGLHLDIDGSTDRQQRTSLTLNGLFCTRSGHTRHVLLGLIELNGGENAIEVSKCIEGVLEKYDILNGLERFLPSRQRCAVCGDDEWIIE